MTLKELRQLIKLCRAEGVQSIRFEGVEMHLGDAPRKPVTIKRPNAAKATEEIMAGVFDPAPGVKPPVVEQGKVETEELTPEQLLFYSSGAPEGVIEPN